jgi:glycosyltransferase involved in cell wall biosynthesis
VSQAHETPLRVCIDARVREGVSGGVQQEIIGLASGLSQLEGPERYFFLVEREPVEWLQPYLGGSCRLLPSTPRPGALGKQLVKRAVPGPLLDAAFRALAPLFPTGVALSDGTVEQAGIDVMHFALQHGFRTAIPSIYVPQDLQHVHLPELFGRADLRWRRAVYPALCRQAACVVALSKWGRHDLIDSFGLAPEKVRVIPLAPAVDAYAEPAEAEVADVRRRRALPEAFAFFPAQTFPHKNHLLLLEALAVLRDRDGVRVPLVCSGHRDSFYPEIQARIRRLRLEDHVSFLGFVTTLELQCLYRLCRMLVFPSRFEGFGMPVLEAFRLGVPVACSKATCLGEIAGEAALLFDPLDRDSIASAVRAVWTDAKLSAGLAAKGRARASGFSWRKTALQYRALYRLLAGRAPDADDRTILAEMRV